MVRNRQKDTCVVMRCNLSSHWLSSQLTLKQLLCDKKRRIFHGGQPVMIPQRARGPHFSNSQRSISFIMPDPRISHVIPKHVFAPALNQCTVFNSS